MRRKKMKIDNMNEVCNEILDIMEVYDEQEAKRGYIDTPGGLEHMGDVWAKLRKWSKLLLEED
jgi:hypothetical protein